jgi:hypothetical protein
MLIAALIFAVSFGLLIQFFVAYCRSLISEAFAVELSPQAHEVTGIDDHQITPGDFGRMLQLVRLCPGPGSDRLQLAAVRAYYGVLHAAGGLVGTGERIQQELKRCSYFAAVALDRRMAHNRALLADQGVR